MHRSIPLELFKRDGNGTGAAGGIDAVDGAVG